MYPPTYSTERHLVRPLLLLIVIILYDNELRNILIKQKTKNIFFQEYSKDNINCKLDYQNPILKYEVDACYLVVILCSRYCYTQ